MRKRLIASVFIAFLLCASAFAGHTMPGGGFCECGSSPDCICDPGETPRASTVIEPVGVLDESVSDNTRQGTSLDLGSEALFVLAALILALRYKA